MKCPNCGVRIAKETDCTSCGKWNGAGRPRDDDKGVPLYLSLHTAIRTRDYKTVDALCHGSNAYLDHKDEFDRDPLEYAMYLGDLKAVKIIRKRKAQTDHHKAWEGSVHKGMQKAGLAIGDDRIAEMQAAARGEVLPERKESPLRAALAWLFALAVMGGVGYASYLSPSNGHMIGFGVLPIGTILVIRAGIQQKNVWPWVLMMMVAGGGPIGAWGYNEYKKSEAASRNVRPVTEKQSPIPTRIDKAPRDTFIDREIISIRELVRAGQPQEAQKRLMELVQKHPKDAEVLKLKKEFEALLNQPMKKQKPKPTQPNEYVI